MKNLFVSLIIFVGATCVAEAQISSGGNYTLDQSVIASGGGTSSAGTFTVEGTSGQAIAGANSFAPNFTVKSGFWTAQPFAPSAASVSLGGRVTTSDGSGVRNVFVTLTQANGTTRTTLTASFGYFKFDEIEVGQTVIINIRAKRFTFAQPTLILNVAEDLTEINFVANE